MLNNQQGLGKAKNINIIDFTSINEYNIWCNNNPQYIIYDIQIIPFKNAVAGYKVFIVYLKVNE